MTADVTPTYADAIAELDVILDQLESGDADIDALAAQVGRAAELVRLCRDRLDGARTEVTRIVTELDGNVADPANEPEGTTDGDRST